MIRFKNKEVIPKKKAFTLAEVLITLGIIGVVAAMTIPALINHSNNLEYKVALKKAYSVMSEATNRIKNENGGTFSGFWANSNAFHFGVQNFSTLYSDYMSVIRTCGVTKTTATTPYCWHPDGTWFNSDGTPEMSTCSSCAAFYTKDGMIFHGYYTSPDCSTGDSNANKTFCAFIWVDVNGDKLPNKKGTDIFRFYITKDGLNYGKTEFDFLNN